MLEAAEECGIRDEVENLRNLARDIGKSESSVDDCVSGYEVKEKMDNLGIDLEEVDGFLSGLLQDSQDQGLSGEQVGELAGRLHAVRVETGLGYSKLVEESERIAEEKKINEENVASLRDDVKKLEEKQQRKLEEAETTDKMLVEYLEDKENLGSYGLEVSDIGKSSKVLKALHEFGYDTTKVTGVIIEYGSLTGAIEFKEQEKEEAEKQVEGIKTEIRDLEKIKSEKNSDIEKLKSQQSLLKKPLDALTYLFSNNVMEDDVIKVKTLVEKAGYTIDSLVAKLETLGSLNNVVKNQRQETKQLENHLTKLKEEQKTSKEDIEYMKEEKARILKETKEIHDKYKDWVIDILQKLEAKINDPKTGLSTTIKKALDGTLEGTLEQFNSFKMEFLAGTKDVKTEASEISKQVDELYQEIFAQGTRVGIYSQLNNLANLYTGGALDPVNKKITIVSTLDMMRVILERESFHTEAAKIGQVRDTVLKKY
jgi:hypothetical protein